MIKQGKIVLSGLSKQCPNMCPHLHITGFTKSAGIGVGVIVATANEEGRNQGSEVKTGSGVFLDRKIQAPYSKIPLVSNEQGIFKAIYTKIFI
jgi:hypothetical protein